MFDKTFESLNRTMESLSKTMNVMGQELQDAFEYVKASTDKHSTKVSTIRIKKGSTVLINGAYAKLKMDTIVETHRPDVLMGKKKAD